MTKAEYIEHYGIERYERMIERNKAYRKERYHNDPEYREAQKIHSKERYHNDPEYREYQREFKKEYCRNNLTSTYKTKSNIRKQSRRILFDKRHHTKLKDYEIHHCFGYDDPNKFVYIHRELHIDIHQYLRDNGIDADSNHYNYIVNMINEYTGYTYISV